MKKCTGMKKSKSFSMQRQKLLRRSLKWWSVKNLHTTIDKQIDIIWSVMETEAEVAEYIDNFSFSEINLQAVKNSKVKFIEINQKILMHIQKKQLHGYNLEGVRNTVQLEIETLRKETSLM